MIVLASKSPRRREYLDLLSLPYTVCTKEIDEYSDLPTDPSEAVKLLSYKKAAAVQDQFTKEDLIIGGDTLVYAGNQILSKPKNPEDAARMLRLLSDSVHTVYSGLTVLQGKKAITRCVATKVFFKKLEEEEIEGYLRTEEPFDKAGAYGIQGKGGLFVTRIEGDYSAVVGLPLPALYEILHEEFGVNIL